MCIYACASEDTISDYFAKLGAVCARLNILNKPMQIFNVDETRIIIVHKPGKVITEVGWKNVWSLTSAEKGKTHTVLACASALALYSLHSWFTQGREYRRPSRRELFLAQVFIALGNARTVPWMVWIFHFQYTSYPTCLVNSGWPCFTHIYWGHRAGSFFQYPSTLPSIPHHPHFSTTWCGCF